MQKDFNTFADIKHKPLRIFNRAVFACNIMDDSGRYATEEYFDFFSPEELSEIFTMIKYINLVGPHKAKELALKDFTPEEEDHAIV